MKYVWYSNKPVAYFCCVVDRRCVGASCPAWKEHPNKKDTGRCLFVPADEGEGGTHEKHERH